MLALISLLLKLSVALVVFGFGLKVHWRDLAYLWHKPRLLLCSLLGHSVLMPLLALGLVLIADVSQSVKLALLAVSVSTVPPRLPKKVLAAGGDEAYMASLMLVLVLLSIVLVPLSANWVAALFGLNELALLWPVIQLVLISVWLPLVAGLAVNHFWPRCVDRVEKPLHILATVFFAIAVLPLLYKELPDMVASNNGLSLLLMVVFVGCGIVFGHLLAGSRVVDQTVLALSMPSKHPGMALAIAHLALPAQTRVVPVICLYLVVNLILSRAYISWAQRQSKS